MLNRLGLFVILSFSLLIYGSSDANGLSCLEISLQSSYDSSDVIFLGHVVSKEYVTLPEWGELNYQDSIVQFEVKETFKGFPGNFVTLTTHEWFWSTVFEEGKDYVVFAIYKSPTFLTDQLCTVSSSPDSIDLEQLRLLQMDAEKSNFGIWWNIKTLADVLIVGGIVIASVAVALFFFSKKKIKKIN